MNSTSDKATRTFNLTSKPYDSLFTKDEYVKLADNSTNPDPWTAWVSPMQWSLIIIGILIIVIIVLCCIVKYYKRQQTICIRNSLDSLKTKSKEGGTVEMQAKLVSLHRFNLDEFSTVKVLGQGSFSQVHLLKGRVCKKQFAGKFFIQALTSDSNFLKEVELLQQASTNCPYIVNVIGIVLQPETKVLIMEYLEHGSLDKVLYNDLAKIDGESEYPILKRLSFIMDMIKAIHHLHKQNIVHRDIASRNLLLSNDKKFCLLADFSLARTMKNVISETNYTYTKVVPKTSAPEILEGVEKTVVSMKSDIWSLAMTMSEILNKRSMALLRRDSDVTIMNLPTSMSSVDEEVRSKKGSFSKTDRRSFSECVHPFLKSLDESPSVVPERLFYNDMHIDSSVFCRECELWGVMLRCFQHKAEDRPQLWELESTLRTIYQNPTNPADHNADYFVKEESTFLEDDLRKIPDLPREESVASVAMLLENQISVL